MGEYAEDDIMAAMDDDMDCPECGALVIIAPCRRCGWAPDDDAPTFPEDY